MTDLRWRIIDRNGALIGQVVAGGLSDLEDAVLRYFPKWTLVNADESVALAMVAR